MEGHSDLRKPGISQVSILFSITILLFLLIGYRAQHREFYTGILITELGLILLPALIFVMASRYDIKRVLRLNKASFLNFFTVFWLMVFAMPLAGIINLANLFIVDSIFGKIVIKQAPVPGNVPELLLAILVVAGSAGLCEEFLFRGVIQRGFERFGTARAIMAAAMLFSLTHLDFQKLFFTFALGCLIGFIVYRTNSLYCGMFAHFTNNSAVVLMSYLGTRLMEKLKARGLSATQATDLKSLFAGFSVIPKEQLVIVLFVYGFVFLLFVGTFIALLYAFLVQNPARRSAPASKPEKKSTGLLWTLPGISLIVTMYFAQVLSFRGVDSGFVEVLKRLLGAL